MSKGSRGDAEKIVSELIQTLVSLIEEKDPYMRGHSERVASNAVYFGMKLGLPKKEIELTYLGSLLHDIGMVYIPVEIIQKPGALTEEEMKVVRQHPVLAEKILSHMTRLKGVLPIIRHHHEFFDGTGYPDGLKGDAIPLSARILTLSDCYDAMVSHRPNRKALKEEEAVASILQDAGKKFGPDLARDFVHFIQSGTSSSTEEMVPEQKEPLDDLVSQTIEQFNKGEIDLPVLPQVVHEVQQAINRPGSSGDALVKIIEKDAIISVRLLSIVNSPLFRGTEKITSLSKAIPRLGVKETQNIVVTIANKGLYETKESQLKKVTETLWLHSLACAYGAKIIGGTLGIGDQETLFFMGLIHDIGKAPLLKALTETASSEILAEPTAVMNAIHKVHTGFGSDLVRRWKFAQEFVEVVKFHEGPHFPDDVSREVLIVNLANNMSRKLGYSQFDNNIDLDTLESTKRLEVTTPMIERIEVEVRNYIEESARIF